jgi:hypothetical protein
VVGRYVVGTRRGLLEAGSQSEILFAAVNPELNFVARFCGRNRGYQIIDGRYGFVGVLINDIVPGETCFRSSRSRQNL